MSALARSVVALPLALALLLVGTGSALGAQPVTERSGRTVETFADDFILELCGIETMTTVIERWTLTTYADGSRRLRVSRKFLPADPRIPVEYGAGMSFWDANGVQTVHGTPIHLKRPGEGTILIDAGFITLSDDPTVHGPHPSRDMDLAAVYCP